MTAKNIPTFQSGDPYGNRTRVFAVKGFSVAISKTCSAFGVFSAPNVINEIRGRGNAKTLRAPLIRAIKNGLETMLPTSPSPDLQSHRTRPMAKRAVTAIPNPRARSASLRGDALTPHETRILAMMADDPTLRRKGLGRQIAKYGSHPDRAYEMRTPGFVPDLFSVDFDRLQLRLYEVESSHPLTPAKIQTIAVFAMELDAHEEWDVRLYAVDVHGTEPREIDLVAAYIGACRDHGKANPRSQSLTCKPGAVWGQCGQGVSDLLQTGGVTP